MPAIGAGKPPSFIIFTGFFACVTKTLGATLPSVLGISRPTVNTRTHTHRHTHIHSYIHIPSIHIHTYPRASALSLSLSVCLPLECSVTVINLLYGMASSGNFERLAQGNKEAKCYHVPDIPNIALSPFSFRPDLLDFFHNFLFFFTSPPFAHQGAPAVQQTPFILP